MKIVINNKYLQILVLLLLVFCVFFFIHYKYMEYREKSQLSICNDIALVVGNNTEYGIHPFVSSDGLAVVIPASWDIDAMKIYKRGMLVNMNFSDKTCINLGGVKIKIYQSNIASIQINTASGCMDDINTSIDKSVSESGTMLVINKEGLVEYDGFLKEIKGRGNGTWRQNIKKPYNIKLPNKTQILGLKRAKKYCLLANDKDNTHLKNWLALNIAKELGTEYPVDCEHAAVWFNGRYAGLYLVTNKVDVAESSVDIRDLEKDTQIFNDRKLKKYATFNTGDEYSDSWECLPQLGGTSKGIYGADNPKDISGGYLLDHAGRLFTYARAESGFVTPQKWTVIIKSPKYATREQVDYISGQYEAMDRAITSNDGVDEDGHYYTDIIDLHSFVTYFLCQEVLMNHDGGMGSLNLFKPEDSISHKFYAGPIWDFDVSFNNGTADVGRMPQAYIIKDGVLGCPNNYRGVLGEVAKHNDFMDSVKVCYANDMRPILEKYLFSRLLDDKREELEADVTYNAMLWKKDFNAYKNECDEMVAFMRERISFLDADWIDEIFDHTIILDVGWAEKHIHYHKMSLRIRKGDTVSGLPKYVNSYYWDTDSYKGKGWFVAGTDSVFNPMQPIYEDLSLEYRWESRPSLEISIRKKYKILYNFFNNVLSIRK